MNHPSLIVLKALLNGQEIQENGYTILMSGDNEVCIKVLKNDKEELLIDNEWSLTAFIKFCQKIPEADLVALAAGNTLRQIAREKNAKRINRSMRGRLGESDGSASVGDSGGEDTGDEVEGGVD